MMTRKEITYFKRQIFSFGVFLACIGLVIITHKVALKLVSPDLSGLYGLVLSLSALLALFAFNKFETWLMKAYSFHHPLGLSIQSERAIIRLIIWVLSFLIGILLVLSLVTLAKQLS